MTVHVLLSGTVGPSAYGLVGTGRQNRSYGLFAVDTQDLHVVELPKEARDIDGIDCFEARYWCERALMCDPDFLEMLWLPVHDQTSELGRDLLDIRQAFLSRRSVAGMYSAAAGVLLDDIRARAMPWGDNVKSWVSGTAQDMLRLCWQGHQLLLTGELPVRVDDPHRFHAFGQKVADGHLEAAGAVLSQYRDRFALAKSSLPEEPDRAAVDRWMRFVRLRYL